MTLRQFLNRVRDLRFVDYDEMVAAGVEGAEAAWPSFRSDPIRWLTAASDTNAAKLWAYMDAREPPGVMAAPPTVDGLTWGPTLSVDLANGGWAQESVCVQHRNLTAHVRCPARGSPTSKTYKVGDVEFPRDRLEDAVRAAEAMR